MTAFIGWIDHDERERERMKRILALFSERETRDELGLGGVRDSISDHLFPGTSTIQTRLRYMLFVPWVYQRFEEVKVRSDEIADRARLHEYALTDALLEGGESDGVFGSSAGYRLKRLASSVYWAGLGDWGIRRFSGSQDAYHQALDSISAARRMTRKREDESWEQDSTVTWDPKIPSPPDDLLVKTTCELTRDEGDYLVDRVVVSHRDSLLAFLMRERCYSDAKFVWEHPDYAGFSQRSCKLLGHARLFSEVMFGASILYNLLLSEVTENEEKVEKYRAAFEDWSLQMDSARLNDWSLDQLWLTATHPAHRITSLTRRFITDWVSLVAEDARHLDDSPLARSLIANRERRLKGKQSRFDNLSARARWGGASGYARLSYRWPNVQVFLQDLKDAA